MKESGFSSAVLDSQLAPVGHAGPDRVREALDSLAVVAQDQQTDHQLAGQKLALNWEALGPGHW